jgi:nitroimidazol reductase NimA-like FMN-containing flavoprotein (pyridoxamine 5'-phosphate oxidase superfamily)
MSADEAKAGVELTDTQSWALLRESVVGRLALIVDGGPEIFPVNHLVDHGSVVFRTAAGTKLAEAVGQTVAFEVDEYDRDKAVAWSVVVKGVAHEVKGMYEVLDMMVDLPLFPWHSEPKPHFVRIEPVAISGRRFEATGGPRPAAFPYPLPHTPQE